MIHASKSRKEGGKRPKFWSNIQPTTIPPSATIWVWTTLYVIVSYEHVNMSTVCWIVIRLFRGMSFLSKKVCSCEPMWCIVISSWIQSESGKGGVEQNGGIETAETIGSACEGRVTVWIWWLGRGKGKATTIAFRTCWRVDIYVMRILWIVFLRQILLQQLPWIWRSWTRKIM